MDIYKCTRGTEGSPGTGDKQVGNLVSVRHKKNGVNPQRAPRLPAQNGLSPTRISPVSHTQVLPLFLRFYYNSRGPRSDHTHRQSVLITPHHASTVGTVPGVGSRSEWSHYSAVTSHSFSLLSNQVSSHHKSCMTTMLLCHPAVVSQCSRLNVSQKKDTCVAITTRNHCVLWCSRWGCSGTMETGGTGQWEV